MGKSAEGGRGEVAVAVRWGRESIATLIRKE